jgi:hypothetical protein
VGKVEILPLLRDFQTEGESPAFGLFHAVAFSTALLPTDLAIEPKDHPNWFIVKWSSPPFLPGTPIRLTLFSKTLIRVTELKQIDYTFP